MGGPIDHPITASFARWKSAPICLRGPVKLHRMHRAPRRTSNRASATTAVTN